MGGRHSKQHSSGSSSPPLPALVILDWNAAFLGARMAEGAATTPADPSHRALAASSPALAQAFRPLVDARRLIALAEEGTPTQRPPPTSSLAAASNSSHPSPPLNVRSRLVLFPADLSVMNHRLHRLFHRRGYRGIVGPRELQAHAVARALGRFGRRQARRHHQRHNRRRHHHAAGRQEQGPPPLGVVVVVAGDGGLERHPAFASALRALLHQGFALEAWAWMGGGAGHAPQLYQELAAQFPSTPAGGGVRLRALDEHRARLRYGGAGPTGRGGLDGLVASTLHSVAAAVVTAASGIVGLAPPSAPPPHVEPAVVLPPLGQQPPPVPVAVPVAVGVGEGGEGVVQGYFLPAGEGKPGALESSDEEEDDDRLDEGPRAASAAAAAAAAAAASGEGPRAASAAAAAAAAVAAASGEEEEEDLPEYLLDPLTFEPLDDPVLAPSGYTFSRAVILDQIRRRGTDPFTNAPLAEGDLRPNRALAEAVEAYRQRRVAAGKGPGSGAGVRA
jgi:hypothetical protein